MAMIEQLAETAANAMQSIAREFQLSPEMLRGFEFVNLLADLPVIADTDQSTDDRYPVDRLTRVLDVEPAELLIPILTLIDRCRPNRGARLT
jgi:hypothetical protein